MCVSSANGREISSLAVASSRPFVFCGCVLCVPSSSSLPSGSNFLFHPLRRFLLIRFCSCDFGPANTGVIGWIDSFISGCLNCGFGVSRDVDSLNI